MTRSPVLDDEAFEAELRAMLARRATDVRPARPPVPAGPTAVPLVRPASRRRRWAAVAAAAAAVLVVAGAAVMLAGGVGRDRAETDSGPAAEPAPPDVPDVFQTLGAVWPVVGRDALAALVADPGDMAATLSSPESAAAAYLAEVAPAATADLGGTVVGPDGDATVPWSSVDLTGVVALRNAGVATIPIWVVTGAETDGVQVTFGALESAGTDIGFALHVTGPATGHELRVEAFADGEEAMVRNGPAHPDGTTANLEVVAPWGADVEVLVRAVDATGDYLSTSHTGFTLPATPEAPEAPDAPADPGLVGEGAVEMSGTFAGTELFTFTADPDCEIDHSLDATLTIGDSTTWSLTATYCGSMSEGAERVTAEGVFTLTTPGGDTLSGRLLADTELATSSGPFTLEVAEGTGAYAGATGSCTLDSRLIEDPPPDSQAREGTFSCEISR